MPPPPQCTPNSLFSPVFTGEKGEIRPDGGSNNTRGLVTTVLSFKGTSSHPTLFGSVLDLPRPGANLFHLFHLFSPVTTCFKQIIH